jgi:hypothetical protein
MTDENKIPAEVVDEQRQASQTSTADIAAALNKRSVDMTQAPANRIPGEPAAGTTGPAPLLPTNDIKDLRSRWTDIQAGFVDKPRESVEQADALVAGVMKRLAETFANERSKLEGQWSRGDDVSTEDLRVALQHYRSFFDRLLSL